MKCPGTFQYNIKVNEEDSTISVADMPYGALGIATEGFKGELFHKSVAGIVGISANRYWPSRFITKDEYQYQPCFKVRVIVDGTISVTKK
jgi:hypothetical protein